MMRSDEYSSLKKDNEQFLEEEKDRLQMEAEQQKAEACQYPRHFIKRIRIFNASYLMFCLGYSNIILQVKLSTSQGKVLTIDQMVQLQDELANKTSQLSHLALHIQCLQAENEKLMENVEALQAAHKVLNNYEILTVQNS